MLWVGGFELGDTLGGVKGILGLLVLLVDCSEEREEFKVILIFF